MTTYTKTTWNAAAAPGISATALNNLETQYDDAMTQYSTYVPAPASTTPSVGSTTHWARGDHVHSIPALFIKTTVSNTLQMSSDTQSSYVISASYVAIRSFIMPVNLVLQSSVRVKIDIAPNTVATSDYSIQVSLGGGLVSGTTGNIEMISTGFTTLTFDGTYTNFTTPTVLAKGNAGYTIRHQNCRVYGDSTSAIPASSWG
jgi:hypothetical protein